MSEVLKFAAENGYLDSVVALLIIILIFVLLRFTSKTTDVYAELKTKSDNVDLIKTVEEAVKSVASEVDHKYWKKKQDFTNKSAAVEVLLKALEHDRQVAIILQNEYKNNMFNETVERIVYTELHDLMEEMELYLRTRKEFEFESMFYFKESNPELRDSKHFANKISNHHFAHKKFKKSISDYKKTLLK